MNNKKTQRDKKHLRYLGVRLIKAGLITREQLEYALHEQQGNSEVLGKTLTRLGYISEKNIRPFITDGNGAYPVAPLELGQLDSPALSEFYQLQSRIKFALFSESPVKTILVTSALPNEGKSLCTTYLGIITAITLGKRVLLIDSDLRHPTFHKIFHLSNMFGLSDVLVETATLDRSIQRTKLDNLHVLTAGTNVSNPTSLLSSNRMDKLLKHLQSRYYFIFLDSPPVLVTPDPTMLATIVQGAILVVKANISRMRDLQKMTTKLNRANINIMGVLLNHYCPPKGESKYYSPHYNDYYKHTEPRN